MSSENSNQRRYRSDYNFSPEDGRGPEYERQPWQDKSSRQDPYGAFERRGFQERGRYERGRFWGKGPKGYQRSDTRIEEDVNHSLYEDDELDASEITVSVKVGEVTLEGSVETRNDKRRAEDLAESISGVKDVHNRLRARVGLLGSMFGMSSAGEDSSRHMQ